MPIETAIVSKTYGYQFDPRHQYKNGGMAIKKIHLDFILSLFRNSAFYFHHNPDYQQMSHFHIETKWGPKWAV